MSAITASPHDLMRRAIAAMDADEIFAIIDEMHLDGVKLPAVVAVPLKSLQKKHDLLGFAAGAPIDAVSSLLEFLSMQPLEQVVALLGDHAENPNHGQLSGAIGALRAQGASRNDVIAVLALAAGQEFPAASVCRQLLDEGDDLQLPDLTITVGSNSLLSPKEQDAAVLEQRRLRREEEKARKKLQAEKARAPKVKYEKKPKVQIATTPKPVAAVPVVDLSRRDIMLTPAEQALFEPTHPLAGWVVMTDVPFDAVDPAAPEVHSKIRPALVVAGSATALLVRGIYSDPFVHRVLFQPWRRVGLDHLSYIDDRRFAVAMDDTVTKLGQLSDAEWNLLL